MTTPTHCQFDMTWYINDFPNDSHEKQITSWVNPVTHAYIGADQSSHMSSRMASRTTSHVSITTPPQQ